MDLYRWINSKSSWTRIGTGSAFDHTHSTSAAGKSTVSSPEEEGKAIRALIAQMCEKFYSFGWASGTAGGVSIRTEGTEKGSWRVFVTPSGAQKEDMIGNDIFELDMESNVIAAAKTPNSKLSACTPLWFIIYRLRPSAKCTIHIHSVNAHLATLLDPSETSKVLRLTHMEMLKGVGNHAYDDILEIPIIDNRPSEDLLSDQMEEAIKAYPKCNAVLVRRHGLFVWGDSWEQAKTQCESFDYLFQTAIEMKKLGMDFSSVPQKNMKRKVQAEEPSAKRLKINGGASGGQAGFNGVEDVNNNADLTLEKRSMIPLLPKECKILLLDIEGCTTSISFVKDVLFPYVLKNIDSYLSTLALDDVQSIFTSLQKDIEVIKDPNVKKECEAVPVSSSDLDAMRTSIKSIVEKMVQLDVKATGLKGLQGKMWKAGYASGELKGHVYSDFPFLLNWCKENDVQVNIYSSGSIGAQKLLFSKSIVGDLCPHFHSHFDTTSGGKKESQSYLNIAKALGVAPSEICFVSDAEAELVAARQAGVGYVVMSVRPGNAVMTDVGYEFPRIFSLMQLCGC